MDGRKNGTGRDRKVRNSAVWRRMDGWMDGILNTFVADTLGWYFTSKKLAQAVQKISMIMCWYHITRQQIKVETCPKTCAGFLLVKQRFLGHIEKQHYYLRLRKASSNYYYGDVAILRYIRHSGYKSICNKCLAPDKALLMETKFNNSAYITE